MEITDFLTENFLSTFTGTLVAVELIVSVSKELYLIKRIPTKLYTFILAIIHLGIVKGTSGQLSFNIQSLYILFLNAIVVAILLCGGYDTVIHKLKDVLGEIEKVSETIDSEQDVKK